MTSPSQRPYSPQVSVVIPTHDRLALVREAVASVLAQTFADYELIVVDDGSTDDTAAALAAEYGARLRIVRTATNRGASAARNRGALEARGRWLAFLDSDDTWLPAKLERQMAYVAERPEVIACQTKSIWIRHGVRVNPGRRHEEREGDIFEPSLERCLVAMSSLLLRRDVFESSGGFDETLPACEDYDLWLRLSRAIPFHVVREPLVVRREGHPDQLSHRYWGMDRFRVASLRKLLEMPLTPPQRRATVAVLERKCAILAHGAARRGREDEAAAYRRMVEAYV